jgi:hypothetical protein
METPIATANPVSPFAGCLRAVCPRLAVAAAHDTRSAALPRHAAAAQPKTHD